MTTSSTSSIDDGDEIDLRELFGILLDHKWLIIAVTSAALLLSVAYALLSAPVYQANAMVQVEKKMPTLPGLSDLSQMVGDSAPEAVTETALMTSRMVVGHVVDTLGVDIQATPQRLPLLGGFIARHFRPAQHGAVASPRFGLSRYDWGGARLDIARLDLPDELVGQPFVLTADAAGQYGLTDDDGNLLLRGQVGQRASANGITILVRELQANPGQRFDVVREPRLKTISGVQKILGASEQGKDSGIIAVSYQDTDPKAASAVLNGVVAEYVHQNVARASAEAANSLDFVNQQLPIIHKSLEKAEEALSSYQTQVRTADISLQTKGLLDQIVAVETSLSELKLQQAEVEGKFTAKHPAYKALQEQISDLDGKKQQLEKRVTALPETQQGLLRLMRDVQVSTATYTAMMTQAQQLDVARAGTVGNARIIDHAAVDITEPVAPKKAVVVLGGTMLGGFLAVAWVFLSHMLNRGVEDPSAIEQLGLAVYASVPLSDHQAELDHRGDRRKRPAPKPVGADRRQHGGKVRILALDDPADLAIEAMRSLRTSLHFARLEAPNNVLMIAGASPGAGKTFISTNLAAVVALNGERVLLIDADMRKGVLHKVMGGAAKPGLAELLTGRTDLETALHKTPLEGMHFISRGHAPANPSELLSHRNFAALLEQLSAQYDLVIVDTPPVLAVTDAAIIGKHVGVSLLVARFGLNQARELALAKQRFEQNRVQLTGAVFNAVRRRAMGYYAYGYYAYRTTDEGADTGVPA